MVLFGPLWVAICLHRHIGSTRRARLCVCVHVYACACVCLHACVYQWKRFEKQPSPQRSVLSDNAMTTGLLLPPHPSPPPPSPPPTAVCITSKRFRGKTFSNIFVLFNLLFVPLPAASPECYWGFCCTVQCKNHLFIVVELCFSLFFFCFFCCFVFCFDYELTSAFITLCRFNSSPPSNCADTHSENLGLAATTCYIDELTFVCYVPYNLSIRARLICSTQG